MSARLKSEAQMVATLRSGAYMLGELYARCELECDIERDHGLEPPTPEHLTDTRWKRRLRGKLMTLRRSGKARKLTRSCWLIYATATGERALILLMPGARIGGIELRVQDAADLLDSLEEPCDVVMTDPPYGLGWDTRRSQGQKGHYRRNQAAVLGDGYVDVDPERYLEFTARWVAAAARALRPGGQLVAVTGPQRAAPVQFMAEREGMSWVCSIAARHQFALHSKRRPTPAHWTITVMCSGRLEDPRRVFCPPPDLPRSQAGNAYPLDWWEDNGRSDRPGLLRYATELPLLLTRRLMLAFSEFGEHVVDPMLGGGNFAYAAFETGRRFTGGDVNRQAVDYTAARLLVEHAWSADQPARRDHGHVAGPAGVGDADIEI